MSRVRRAALPLTLLALLLTLALGSARLRGVRAEAETAERIERDAAAVALREALRNLELRLSKAPLSDAPEEAGPLLAETALAAQAAAQALAALPLEDESGESALAFLQRLRACCISLLGKVCRQTPLSTEDMELLARAQSACRALDAAARDWDFADLDAALAIRFPEEAAEPVYPVMIYDGPFSEAEQNETVVGLSGPEIDLESARAVAAAYLGISPEGTAQEGEVAGDLPGWVFTDGNTRLLVSRQGGHVLWSLAECPAGPVVLTREEALDAARLACLELGLDLPCVTWTQISEGVLTACLAPQEAGAILYPDLVKVKISLADGSLLALDAQRYYRSHTRRDPGKPTLSREQALDLAPAALEATDCRLAYIEPLPHQGRLAWELRGDCRGAPFYLYLDANTGKIIQIFREIVTAEGSRVE